MNTSALHTFHIPVMGLGYTIDTPVKVARFGISSVISIIEDELVEQMRKFHCGQSGEKYIAITSDMEDFRAKRITAYLNLVNLLVERQTEELRNLSFEEGNDLAKYFELLPNDSPVRKMYQEMLQLQDPDEKLQKQALLRRQIRSGDIDVNIMAKADRTNYTKSGEPMPAEFSDALAAFRGFAKSALKSSVVLSAGYNPRLYSYIESFPDFFPDTSGTCRKKIILKVSDYRSALIQGRLLAKKGIWISEFRIESGLNCGGHAFATEGLLLGPILEEFKVKKAEIMEELMLTCNVALKAKGALPFLFQPELKVTVQGGIGTANENKFLLDYYGVDATGWGSPFLLVPEATNVDPETLNKLASAKKEDYYLSHASPLGIPFNNFRKSSSEAQRKKRIEQGRPGSPCYKKFLSFNTEFTATPICTASREYQNLKIKELEAKSLPADQYDQEFKNITDKDCLCEGLGTGALIKNGLPLSHGLKAAAICPGPNLAYFSNSFSLKQMVDHIYGRKNILNSLRRPNMFVNELSLYVDFLKNEIRNNLQNATANKTKYINNFRNNLLLGIEYYRNLAPRLKLETEEYIVQLKKDLDNFENAVSTVFSPAVNA
ncbi:MAG TPA: hypothetical protein PLU53_04415 [Bacteroidia bacterium]|nr:hypothetical protein [Bacteroidia bacterium]